MMPDLNLGVRSGLVDPERKIADEMKTVTTDIEAKVRRDMRR